MGSLIGFKSKAKDKKYHSGLEESVAAALKAQGVPIQHEEITVEYDVPMKPSRFTPNFVLGNGIVVHTFRYFDLSARKKLVMIRNQHPALDLRLVFTNSLSKIVKGSKVSYGQWCDRMGFLYADKSIPRAWTTEVLSDASRQAARKLPRK